VVSNQTPELLNSYYTARPKSKLFWLNIRHSVSVLVG
jgi:hypothetical protein